MGFWGSLCSSLSGSLGSVAATVVGQAATALSGVALEACRDYLGQGLSDGEKRRRARRRIGIEAKRRGLQLSDSAVNLAIELAVAQLKEGK